MMGHATPQADGSVDPAEDTPDSDTNPLTDEDTDTGNTLGGGDGAERTGGAGGGHGHGGGHGDGHGHGGGFGGGHDWRAMIDGLDRGDLTLPEGVSRDDLGRFGDRAGRGCTQDDSAKERDETDSADTLDAMVPPHISALREAIDQLLEDGGITLADEDATWAADLLANLEEVVSSDGASLPDPLEARLQDIEDALDALAAGTGNDSLITSLPEALDTLADTIGADLTEAAKETLDQAQDLVDAALSDGSAEDEGDADLLTEASDALTDLREGDVAKLTEDALDEIADDIADLETLTEEGFLALDDDTLAALADLRADLDSVSEDEALADLTPPTEGHSVLLPEGLAAGLDAPIVEVFLASAMQGAVPLDGDAIA